MNKSKPFQFVLCAFVFSTIGFLFSCEKSSTIEPKSNPNTPPFITSVALFPERPNNKSDLNLSVTSKDLDGDPVTYRYQWLKNDEEIRSENRNFLKSVSFNKHDQIRVRVTPSDGKADGPPFLSSSVVILNGPPEVQEAWIEPRRATAGDDLRAHAKGFDPDGDFVYYSYRWEKNGEVLPEEKKPVLEKGRFKKGDSISVVVIPDDRETEGSPKRSEPIVISNSPPIILSSPPDTLERTVYKYQVEANDPDQDPVTFALKSAPKGMRVDRDTGLIHWEVGKEDRGTYPIEIEAADKEGGRSVQRFTLIIDFK